MSNAMEGVLTSPSLSRVEMRTRRCALNVSVLLLLVDHNRMVYDDFVSNHKGERRL